MCKRLRPARIRLGQPRQSVEPAFGRRPRCTICCCTSRRDSETGGRLLHGLKRTSGGSPSARCSGWPRGPLSEDCRRHAPARREDSRGTRRRSNWPRRRSRAGAVGADDFVRDRQRRESLWRRRLLSVHQPVFTDAFGTPEAVVRPEVRPTVLRNRACRFDFVLVVTVQEHLVDDLRFVAAQASLRERQALHVGCDAFEIIAHPVTFVG